MVNLITLIIILTDVNLSFLVKDAIKRKEKRKRKKESFFFSRMVDNK